MSTSVTSLDEAVRLAKLAMVDLVGLVAAEGLNFRALNLMLQPGWPSYIQDAWRHWTSYMNAVCVCLAREAGIAGWLSERDRERFTKQAFDLVMDS